MTKEKIEKKISKFKVFKIEVMKINGEKMNEFIKKVNTQNTPNEETKEENSVPTQYQEQIEEAYNQNKEINEGLIDLIQILFNNIDFQLLLPITNKAFLMNVILNTSFIPVCCIAFCTFSIKISVTVFWKLAHKSALLISGVL